MKRLKILLLISCVILVGCAAPQAVQDRVSADMGENCAKILLGPDYQEGAQGIIEMKTAFAVSRDSENNIAACGSQVLGAIFSQSAATNGALALCEKFRLNIMNKHQKPLQPCEIYAIGNEIK